MAKEFTSKQDIKIRACSSQRACLKQCVSVWLRGGRQDGRYQKAASLLYQFGWPYRCFPPFLPTNRQQINALSEIGLSPRCWVQLEEQQSFFCVCAALGWAALGRRYQQPPSVASLQTMPIQVHDINTKIGHYNTVSIM